MEECYENTENSTEQINIQVPKYERIELYIQCYQDVANVRRFSLAIKVGVSSKYLFYSSLKFFYSFKHIPFEFHGLFFFFQPQKYSAKTFLVDF